MADDTHVYAGVAGTVGMAHSGNLAAVFRQAAGDNRWEQLTGGLPEDAEVHAITVHPERPRHGLCRQHQGHLPQHQSRRQVRAAERCPSDADIWSILVHPKNPQRLYAGASPIRRLSQRRRRRQLEEAGRSGPARPGHHGVRLPGHAARCRSELARRRLRDARSQRRDAQPQRRRELGGLHRRSDPLLRGAEIPQPHRQPDRDRGHARRPCAGVQRGGARHRVPRQPHGAVPQRRPRRALGGHGDRPLLAADLRPRHPHLAARPEGAVRGASARRRARPTARSTAATMSARPGSASTTASRPTRR